MLAVYVAVLLSALALVISVFSFLYFRSYLRRRTGHERILSELRDEVSGILRLIDETTDRDISLIEAREKNLKSLLEEVDKRLRLYVRELDKRQEDETLRASVAAKAQAQVQAQAPTYLELGKNRYRVGAQSLAAEEDSGGAKAGAAPPADEQTKSAPAGEQIRSLVRAGFSAAVIASRLGISIAEVEVTAALMERREEHEQ